MKKILVCNQKMYLTLDEALVLKNKMDKLNYDNIDLIVCPGYLNFNVFEDYKLCAQNCFYEDKGAYTGEISPYDLHLRNINYSLIGHSERRIVEDDKIINLKMKALLKNTMTPILCIGETKLERELRKTSEVIKKQLKLAFKDIVIDSLDSVLIAYEPRYLIGGKTSLSKDDIEDIFKYIRKVLKELNITNYKLLYGASINKENIKEIITDNVDGYLIGNSSVDINELKEIIKCINCVK